MNNLPQTPFISAVFTHLCMCIYISLYAFIIYLILLARFSSFHICWLLVLYTTIAVRLDIGKFKEGVNLIKKCNRNRFTFEFLAFFVYIVMCCNN